MKIEDLGSPRWGPGCSSCWPPFALLRPLICSLEAALTQLVGFSFEP
jgi:hypothetical protein